jgi:DNA-binding transcriptional ArsR family regulator
LPDEMIEAVAEKFRALSQAPRLRLLECLSDGPLHVNAIADRTGLGRANTSRHLAVLTRAGFLTRTRRGMQVAYGLADDLPKQLSDLVCGRVVSEAERDLRRIRSR